jgi:hypothetical protein
MKSGLRYLGWGRITLAVQRYLYVRSQNITGHEPWGRAAHLFGADMLSSHPILRSQLLVLVSILNYLWYSHCPRYVSDEDFPEGELRLAAGD